MVTLVDVQQADSDTTQRIRMIMNERGIGQNRLGELIGLDPSKMSKSLSGRRRFRADELRQIAGQLQVSMDWLTAVPPQADVPEVTRPPESAALSVELYAGARGSTRQRILQAAWRLIAERGLHSVRVSDVAQRCGLSTAAVHYHFDSREEMVEESLRLSVRDAYDRQVADLASIEDPLARLLHLFELQMPGSGPMALEWSIWVQVWAEAATDARIRELHAAAYQRWWRTVQDVIEYGQRRGVFRASEDAGYLTTKLTAMLDGLGIQYLTGRPNHDRELMRRVLRDLINREVLVGGPNATPGTTSETTTTSGPTTTETSKA